jgi:EAL domain-containing protein (putative c-di-GMP-specific phosphodiesterase class I)
MVLNDTNLQINGSIGISIFPGDGAYSSDIMRNADIAMYKAKKEGKARIAYFTETMSREVEENLEIRNILRSAVQDNLLKLVFQPQVDLENNRLRGVEALMRLEHPTRGTQSPDRFLDLAERSGLIVELEDWVLDEALSAGRRILQQTNDAVLMAINVSTQQLFSVGFVEKLKSALLRHRMPAANLEIELTESSVMQSMEDAIVIMRQLKDLGVSLAIDDFGTGYSSLNQLAALPFNVIKVDRELVAALESNLAHQAVLDGVLTMARKLEITVIAEGIETEAQVKLMKNSGISDVQGYYFCKPTPEYDLMKSEFITKNSGA